MFIRSAQKPQVVKILTLEVCVIILLHAIVRITVADEVDSLRVYQLEEVVVTASRMPMSLSSVNRSLVLIDRKTIERLPANTIQDLLDYTLGLDLQTRGPQGVQADVSIRGGSFDQTLVLLNGIKMSDPQTGHHMMNITVPLSSVERVEILRGHGSRLYGPNALGGVVNIVTRRGNEATWNVAAEGGQFGLWGLSGAICPRINGTSVQVAGERRGSDGYTEDTEFEISAFHLDVDKSIPQGSVDLSLGWLDKRFGANRFYSDLFPHQWERTITRSAALKVDRQLGWLRVSPALSWRQNDDEFILDRHNPDFYHSRHATDSYSGELQVSAPILMGITSVGIEYGREKISSGSLGDHSRDRVGAFVEHSFTYRRLDASLGAFASRYTGLDWQVYPGADVGFDLPHYSRIYTSVGSSFRMPTFTDLYYDSPANKGNPALEVEHATSYEVGVSHQPGMHRLKLALFRREGRDLIDWVRLTPDQPWRVQNTAQVNAVGVEVTFGRWIRERPLGIERIETGYTTVSSDRSVADYESKYVLNYMRHQAHVQVLQRLAERFGNAMVFRWKERAGREGVLLVDVQLTWSFGMVQASLATLNLFDVDYRELGATPMPGRWVRLGVRMNGRMDRE